MFIILISSNMFADMGNQYPTQAEAEARGKELLAADIGATCQVLKVMKTLSIKPPAKPSFQES